MKEVYVIRHAHWNGQKDTLTDEGVTAAGKAAKNLPTFYAVHCSPFVRSQQTAAILGKGFAPKIEPTASVPRTPAALRQQILAERDIHPLGIAGALFEEPRALPALRIAGELLAQLIKTALSELPEDQRALIVSHDGTMVAAERILNGTDFSAPLERTYHELEGFIVDEQLNIRDYEPLYGPR